MIRLLANKQEYNNLRDYLESSPDLQMQFKKAAIEAWKTVLTQDKFISYITEDLQKKLIYEDVEQIDITMIASSVEYDLGEIINEKMSIPKNIYWSDTYLDDVFDLSTEFDEVDKWFFRIKNDILLPLTRKKIEFLRTVPDAIGAEHKVDIDHLDIHNREKPFLIVDRTIYPGNKYDEHKDISDYLNSQNVSDKGVAVAYGHIIDDLAFIDLSRTINKNKITMDELKQLIENDPRFIKAYTIPENHSVTRLATRIK